MFSTGIVIPDKEECNSEGFFINQLICPKKDHITCWDMAQITGAYRFDLFIGPVLRIQDLTSGQIFEELPGYIDFLVIQDCLPDGVALLHQLVVPAPETVVSWQIGKIIGFVDREGVDGISLDNVLVADIQNNKRHQVELSDVCFLTRQETSFPRP